MNKYSFYALWLIPWFIATWFAHGALGWLIGGSLFGFFFGIQHFKFLQKEELKNPAKARLDATLSNEPFVSTLDHLKD